MKTTKPEIKNILVGLITDQKVEEVSELEDTDRNHSKKKKNTERKD